MSPRARWGLVAAGVALLLAAPLVARAWPVASSSLTAEEVLGRVRAARTLSYSGLVTTEGDVDLPVDPRVSDVVGLLGGDTSLRVWWQDRSTWRVAGLRGTGETDLVHRGHRLLRWVYESQRVTRVPDLPVRLLRADDLLPPVLADRALDGARSSQLRRLATRRVAGRLAVGLRLVPTGSHSTIGHVDVWADEASGLPLRVEVYADQRSPALTTAFTELDLGQPERSALAFDPPPGSRVEQDYADASAVDVATAADRYSDRVAPGRLAGLPQIRRGLGPVGV
jgi:hypothetical protein